MKIIWMVEKLSMIRMLNSSWEGVARGGERE